MRKLDQRKVNCILFVCFAIPILFLHTFAQRDYGDDPFFASYWGRSLLTVLKLRYEQWSSRVIIEAVVILLTNANPWVWRILNTLMVILLVWNVGDLFGLGDTRERRQAQFFFYGMMWVVPMFSLYSAGWIATTVNYLWTLTLGTVALRPIKRWFTGQKCAPFEYVVCPLCVIFAANMEQMGAILFGVYILCGIYFFAVGRRWGCFYFIMLGLILLSFLFILFSPGNDLRIIAETQRFFPTFQNLNSIQKLEMGFIESAHYYLAAGHEQVSYLFPMLSGILLMEMAARRQRKGVYILQFFIAFYPFAFYWIIGHLGKYLLYHNYLTRGLNIIGVLGLNRQLPGEGNFDAHMVGLQVIIYLFCLGCVVLTIFFLHRKSWETILQLLILGTGFLSRVLIGFSPTLYASGDRTAIFASAAILIVTLRNIQIYLSSKPKIIWKVVLTLYMAANVICNLTRG